MALRQLGDLRCTARATALKLLADLAPKKDTLARGLMASHRWRLAFGHQMETVLEPVLLHFSWPVGPLHWTKGAASLRLKALAARCGRSPTCSWTSIGPSAQRLRGHLAKAGAGAGGPGAAAHGAARCVPGGGQSTRGGAAGPKPGGAAQCGGGAGKGRPVGRWRVERVDAVGVCT